MLGLLSGRQSYLVDKMSQLIIRESSNFEETSCDSELSDWQRDNMQYARSMTHSTDKVDKRLISLYMMNKAHEQGHTFGLENDILIKEKGQLRSSKFYRQHHASRFPSIMPSGMHQRSGTRRSNAPIEGDELSQFESRQNTPSVKLFNSVSIAEDDLMKP